MVHNLNIPLILASGSATRQSLLRHAGLRFEAMPADVDEGAVKQAARAAGWEAAELAAVLAEKKAEGISRKFPDALVIGADQVLVCGDAWFDKPADLTAAAAHLAALSGQTHTLVTAACAYRSGSLAWRHISSPTLTMRSLSPAFIANYLAAEGESVCTSVGAYRLEALGSQLFERIEGDFFTILGLPLLALFGYLRQAGVLLA